MTIYFSFFFQSLKSLNRVFILMLIDKYNRFLKNEDTNSSDADTQFRVPNDPQLLEQLMDSPPTLL